MSNNKQSTEPMVILQTSSTNTAQGIYVEHLKKKVTMSNNKQSSVEWLMENDNQLNIYFLEGKSTQLVYAIKKVRLQEQAKAMHKEEMKQTYFDGWHRNIGNRDEDFEQYYTETFGGEK